MSTRLRPATPDDRAFLAWVMLAASRSHLPRGIWDLMVGGEDASVLAFLERLVNSEVPTFCHHGRFLIAEVDGVPAAALSGYSGADGPGPLGEIEAKAYQDLGWSEDALIAANARVSEIAPCFPEQPPDAWIVEWVATRPEFRRRGLVHSLLESMLARGRSAGWRRAQISILIGNTPAQCAYERVGFRILDERRSAVFAARVGCPGIARLARTL